MSLNLVGKTCVACEGSVPPLSREEAGRYLKETPGWRLLADGLGIEREFNFRDFGAALAFVNKVAALAENEGHHPDIHVFYNRVRLELSTHAIGGLSENDFILAAKVNLIA
ncbi:MAG TPA: 4a-hydroxytetrahydrobiopterin dehydratase [Candidatus Paceibacterota bacterium]|nr:4a-hydroxytetrahydrobiopterin dehydratase [Candidatus Paceibacterota bacterium]